MHCAIKEAIEKQIWRQINICLLSVLIFDRFLCLKTTPTNGVEISRKQKVTVLIRCHFEFNLTDIGFALTEMSLKRYNLLCDVLLFYELEVLEQFSTKHLANNVSIICEQWQLFICDFCLPVFFDIWKKLKVLKHPAQINVLQ